MKKALFLSLGTLIVTLLLQACSKQDQGNNPDVLQTSGSLRYGGDIAADGIGYYVVTDSAANNPSHFLLPENVPSYLRLRDIDIHVKITFYITGKKQVGLNPQSIFPTIHLIAVE